MSSDIISKLYLDRPTLHSRVIVAKEINGCDSSFLTSCLLSHCIKNKAAVIIVSTHNSFKHYMNIGLKLNYNLQKYVDTGLIKFNNLGSAIAENILHGKENKDLLLDFFNTVKDEVKLLRDNGTSLNIILDGISHLFDAGYSLKDVDKFCKDMTSLTRDLANSFVLYHLNIASDVDVTYVMSNLLAYRSDIVIEIESLSSGWSADVTGHLVIKYHSQRYEDEHLTTLDMKPSRYLFKLFDRGIKLFAPGTV